MFPLCHFPKIWPQGDADTNQPLSRALNGVALWAANFSETVLSSRNVSSDVMMNGCEVNALNLGSAVRFPVTLAPKVTLLWG